jgi:superfamily II DNA or RNA helicase/predicted RNA methylase
MRSQGRRKLGFYPTPPAIAEALGTWVRPEKTSGTIHVLDNCCGAGEALLAFSHVIARRYPQIHVETYGIELDPGRAAQAEQNGIAHLLKGINALEEAQIVRRQQARYPGDAEEHAFDVWWCNPPYDSDAESTRLEQRFLRMGSDPKELPVLHAGGLLIFIQQLHRLHHTAALFAQYYHVGRDLPDGTHTVAVRRFPDEEFAAFGQVIVFAVKREKPLPFVPSDHPDVLALRALSEIDAEDPDALKQVKVFGSFPPDGPEDRKFVMPVLADPRPIVFRARVFDPMTAIQQAFREGLATKSAFLETIMPPPVRSMEPPLRDLQEGHTARLLAAGLMDNQILPGSCINPYQHDACSHAMLIRGFTQAVEVVAKLEDRADSKGEMHTYQTNRTQHVTCIVAVDTITGQYHVLSTLKEENESARWSGPDAFILEHHEPLRTIAERQYPPRYALGSPSWPFQTYEDALRQPLGAQSQMIEVATQRLRQHKPMLICGEMGTGKSLTAALAFYAACKDDPEASCLILSPPIMTLKWKDEIERTCPDGIADAQTSPAHKAGVFILRKYADLHDPAFQSARYIILPQTAAKLGNGTRPAAEPRWKYYRDGRTLRWFQELRCPRCGAVWHDKHDNVGTIDQMDSASKPPFCTASRTRLVRDEVKGTVSRNGRRYRVEVLKDKRGHPLECGERLWQYHALSNPGAGGQIVDPATTRVGRVCRPYTVPRSSPKALDEQKPPKVFVATHGPKLALDRVLKRQLYRLVGLDRHLQQTGSLWDGTRAPRPARTFVRALILDEVHELKAEESAQGQSMATLVQMVGGSVLGLTGTISNGYASGLFHLLYRLDPHFRHHWSFSDAAKWVARYGVLETKFEVPAREEALIGAISRRKGRRVLVGTPKERPGFAAPGLKYLLHLAGYIWLTDIHTNLPPYHEYLVPITLSPAQERGYARVREEVQRIFSKRDEQGARLRSAALQMGITWATLPNRPWEIVDKKMGAPVFFQPPIDDDIYPKEQWLIDTCRQERDRQRKTLVYCTHTETYDVPARLAGQLRAAGLRVKILRSSTCKPEERQAWITANAKDTDVLIVHPVMVKVGLDLLDFPTIVFFELNYSIQVTMQACRRSWRIGQHQPVNVYFLSYAQTMEEDALSLIARKRKAATVTDGTFLFEGLGADADDSLEDMLARHLLGGEHDTALERISLDEFQPPVSQPDLLAAPEPVASRERVAIIPPPAQPERELVGVGAVVSRRTIVESEANAPEPRIVVSGGKRKKGVPPGQMSFEW